MILQKTDIQARRDAILAIAIERYIRTCSPVSSSFIASVLPFNVSSATVRNVLAELEEEGYLTHPHTSAGRIPTHKGYRYYVDNLMKEIQLLEDKKQRIKREYQSKTLELERLLEQTSVVLSSETQYTSMISVDGWKDRIILQGTRYVAHYPDDQDLAKIQAILAALDEKKKIYELINQEQEQKINIYIGHEMAAQEVADCSLVVSRYKSRKGPSGRIAVLGPTRMDYERVVSTVDYLSGLIEEFI